MSEHRVPWYLGVVADHLYELCPARVRSRKELEQVGWWKRGRGTVDPDWEGICGWCRRVWKARNKP